MSQPIALMRELEKEIRCTICMEMFTDPVILKCGHNFCE
jgi:hypothetical protein